MRFFCEPDKQDKVQDQRCVGRHDQRVVGLGLFFGQITRCPSSANVEVLLILSRQVDEDALTQERLLSLCHEKESTYRLSAQPSC